MPTTSTPVVLDLVVRDKKNVPIVDLRAEEVELYVDGAKQAFEGFRRVRFPLPAPPPRPRAPEAGRLAVLLFPRLPARSATSPAARPRSSSRSSSPPGCPWPCSWSGPSWCRSRASPPTRPSSRTRSGAPSIRAPGPGTRTSGPLYSLVLWLKGQPGRKTALLFASALAVPPGFEDSLKDVVGLANQQRITLLRRRPARVEMSGGGIQIDQQAVGATGASAGPSTELYGYGGGQQGGGGPAAATARTSGPPSRAPRRRPSAGWRARREASSRRGRTASRRACGRSPRTRAAYYELAYTPAPGKPEGQVRKVEVKVAREGARVQAPQLYRAGDSAAALVPAFEKDLTEALAASPLPATSRCGTGPCTSAGTGRSSRYVLSVAVPLEKVFIEEKPPAEKATTGTFEGSVSVLARVKDASGKVVASFSQRFPLVGPRGPAGTRPRRSRFPSFVG